VYYIALYSPSSPQRLVDCAKVAFSTDLIAALVVIKPVGMAAQVGLAEVSKMAYKMGKNLVILSQIEELVEVLDVDRVLYLVHDPNAQRLSEVLKALGSNRKICIVIPGGEGALPKSDVVRGELVRHSLPQIGNVPAADVALVISELTSCVRSSE